MKKLCSILAVLFQSTYLLANHKIDLMANFEIEQYFVPEQLIARAGYELRVLPNDIQKYLISFYDPTNTKKIIIMGQLIPERELVKFPKEKLIFFLWEPEKLPLSYYDRFSQVYTWDDELVDNVKFFKLYYPNMVSMLDQIPPFEEKKFCTMIVRNWTRERRNILKSFAKFNAPDFDVYGAPSKTSYDRKLYRGTIPGNPNSDEKISTLKNYRFCICFENSYNLAGYISEKIFSCFTAGCVPIYYGAPNIEKYVPKNCYIDYREFSSDRQLYSFLQTMTKEMYEKYLQNIRIFLDSDQARLFTRSSLDKCLYETAIR
jgi:hypothetical protein